jgi:hypothetical protein
MPQNLKTLHRNRQAPTNSAVLDRALPPRIIDVTPVFAENALCCTYASQDYSGGSTVTMPKVGGGWITKTCNGNTGTWDA